MQFIHPDRKDLAESIWIFHSFFISVVLNRAEYQRHLFRLSPFSLTRQPSFAMKLPNHSQ